MQTHSQISQATKDLENIEAKIEEAIEDARKKKPHPRLGKYYAIIVTGLAKDTANRAFSVSVNMDGFTGNVDVPLCMPIKAINILTEHAISTRYVTDFKTDKFKPKIKAKREKRYSVEYLDERPPRVGRDKAEK